jgi:hypothetical protein
MRAGLGGEVHVWSLIVLATETADLYMYKETSQTADCPYLMSDLDKPQLSKT